ncbi:MAG: homoserine dehydrogenase, partial [Pygmaiobacter sp.]
TIGGTEPAYYYVKSALCAGKNVCTSNKELVALHGAELLLLAKRHKVAFLFEASVGGGMPLIAPIHQCLAANVIESVHGIVNGTTNFMLTAMEHDGLSFDAALAEAQRLGYAETRDPSADVDGLDAGRKIAILASLIFGTEIHPADVPTTGIRAITAEDIQFAREMKATIKLIAHAKKDDKGR